MHQIFNLTEHLQLSQKSFFQLLILPTLPGLHILMNGKTVKLYRAVLITIRNLILGFNPTFTMADFELAPWNALSVVFPSVTMIVRWFHFTKALF